MMKIVVYEAVCGKAFGEQLTRWFDDEDAAIEWAESRREDLTEYHTPICILTAYVFRVPRKYVYSGAEQLLLDKRFNTSKIRIIRAETISLI